jgi:hypothetical protein
MEFGKLTVLVLVMSFLERTFQRESLTAPCKRVLVSGADRYGCDGVYSITTKIKLKWPKGKPVYQNVDKNRFMYFNSPYYGWVLSTKTGLQNYMYFYASRLDTSGPTMGVWRPIRNKSVNISVICQDLVTENALVEGFVNDNGMHILSSSSTAMHKESFTIIQALIVMCTQLFVCTKMT